jgi:hypothetical protein
MLLMVKSTTFQWPCSSSQTGNVYRRVWFVLIYNSFWMIWAQMGVPWIGFPSKCSPLRHLFWALRSPDVVAYGAAMTGGEPVDKQHDCPFTNRLGLWIVILIITIYIYNLYDNQDYPPNHSHSSESTSWFITLSNWTFAVFHTSRWVDDHTVHQLYDITYIW